MFFLTIHYKLNREIHQKKKCLEVLLKEQKRKKIYLLGTNGNYKNIKVEHGIFKLMLHFIKYDDCVQFIR